MFELFQYDFIVRGMIAGLIVGAIAPLIGVFLVLRRYALIADTLAHVGLAGVAFGLMLGVPPLVAGIVTATLASFGIERLRRTNRVHSDTALSIFLSGSLALAVILLSVTRGAATSIIGLLFGSILTVTVLDLVVIGALGSVVVFAVIALYRDLVFVTFDAPAAQVAGIRTNTVNMSLMALAALVIALSIPIVGSLLIAALVVIPVAAALQARRGMLATIALAEAISLASTLGGIALSYAYDLPAGGAIVLLTIVCFIAAVLLRPRHA